MMTIPPYNLEMEIEYVLKEQTNGEITPLPQVFRQSQLQGCSSLGSPPEGCFALEICFEEKGANVTLFQEKVSLPWAP